MNSNLDNMNSVKKKTEFKTSKNLLFHITSTALYPIGKPIFGQS